MTECKQQNNLKDCGCSYSGCPRKGKCCECVRYHRGRGELTGCMFGSEGEKTYDRSIENFIRTNS
ncbi:hypothetical protein HN858_02625 [Candidatus Falkowbacteria bacterium]|nr:hypothetical protein [Candidatus Falkowbacteria bacterium]MBT5503815.1 hypothetical protein [Candidatus Falkowbacteria bacterium]MBT6573860.1 hypothetical protein [Candidatus Falkowbacteria bacterium]MBT7348550.1 hypothetical protein [Candidatus Falkowbacteria bacterium]MBT7501066.1 hypothetical protein [Candidatus Falkowbacteria bacterium]